MPMLRQALYSQNVNLYLAPTADARDTWLPLMRTVASEGRCVVLSANQCVRKSNLPSWVTGEDSGTTKSSDGKVITNGTAPLTARLRRKSTTTEDGHEIALPDSGYEKSEQPKLRRKSCVTADGHEIALPDTVKEDEELMEVSKPKIKRDTSEFVCRGGSCIISPLGEVLQGPLWDDDDGLLFVDVDFDDCLRGRLDLDVGGSYSRYDISFTSIFVVLLILLEMIPSN
jgi:nitrilase